MSIQDNIELQWPEKEVGSILDFSVDLDPEETDDYVVGIAAQIKPSGTGELSVGGRSEGDSLYANALRVTAWLQGGVPGRNYIVRLFVYMHSGRVYDLPVILPMSNVYSTSPRPNAPSQDFSTLVFAGDRFAAATIAGTGALVAVAT